MDRTHAPLLIAQSALAAVMAAQYASIHFF